MTTLHVLMLGALATASSVAAVFFLRYWRSSRDRLFFFFSAAFWLLAVDWIAIALAEPVAASRHYVFVPRLLGFVLIIVGIVDKNRQRPPS